MPLVGTAHDTGVRDIRTLDQQRFELSRRDLKPSTLISSLCRSTKVTAPAASIRPRPPVCSQPFTTVLGQRTRRLWILASLVRQHRAPVMNVVVDVGVSEP